MADPLIADLERLVAFPTVSNRPNTELAAFVADRFEALGFRIERFEDDGQDGKLSIVATGGAEVDDDSGLVLSGHMDVVPTEGQPWSSDPFAVAERGGRLYGRGTADMKGFFAATLAAAARMDVRKLKRPVVLVWTHDEEVGCLGSAQLAQKLAGRRLPSACLIGEPTDFRILRMHAGHVGVEVTVTGRAAHSSRPQLGSNAIERASDAIFAIRQLAAEIERERPGPGADETPWVPINVARITGGSAINIVPDRCVVQLGYRPPPGMAADEVYRRIAARLTEADIAVRLLRVTPSMLTPESTPLEMMLARYADVPGSGSAPFATDGGNLARLGVLPLVFGPGSIDVAHKADEFVEVAALHRAVDVVEQLIHGFCD